MAGLTELKQNILLSDLNFLTKQVRPFIYQMRVY